MRSLTRNVCRSDDRAHFLREHSVRTVDHVVVLLRALSPASAVANNESVVFIHVEIALHVELRIHCPFVVR